MPTVIVSASSTSPQSSLQSPPRLLEPAREHEAASSDFLLRDNVEKRILFYDSAIRDALAPSEILSAVGTSKHKCKAGVSSTQHSFDSVLPALTPGNSDTGTPGPI